MILTRCLFIILTILCYPMSTLAEPNSMPQSLEHSQKDSGGNPDDVASRPSSEQAASTKVMLQDWQDSTRNRVIPVKIYFPSSGSGPFPIVVFSHGLGGSREAAQYLGEYWASKGYIGLFIQHAGSDTGVWAKRDQLNRESFMTNMQAAANGKNLADRAADVKFVIDELGRLANSSLFKGKLDLNRIAVAGHSFGAGTSLAVAGQNFGLVRDNPQFLDKRIRAAIYLCPPVMGSGKVNPSKAYGTIQIPGMLLTGTEDHAVIGNTSAEERRIPFDGIKAPHQFLINFYGADHATFGGRSFRKPKPSDEGFHKMIEELTGKFLDATLKNDRLSWQWLESNGMTDYLAKTAQIERK